MKVFVKSIALFFSGKINTQIQEDLEQFFPTKKEFLASKKYKKIQF